MRSPISPSGGFPDSSGGKESTCNAGEPSSIPGSGRSTGEGIGHPFQYPRTSLVAQTARFCQQCRKPGFDPSVGKNPWSRAWQPTPIFLPGESPWTEKHGRLQSMGSQESVQHAAPSKALNKH